MQKMLQRAISSHTRKKQSRIQDNKFYGDVDMSVELRYNLVTLIKCSKLKQLLLNTEHTNLHLEVGLNINIQLYYFIIILYYLYMIRKDCIIKVSYICIYEAPKTAQVYIFIQKHFVQLYSIPSSQQDNARNVFPTN